MNKEIILEHKRIADSKEENQIVQFISFLEEVAVLSSYDGFGDFILHERRSM